MLNKKIILTILIIATLVALIASVFIVSNQKKTGPASDTGTSQQTKLKQESFPPQVKKLIEESVTKPAGAKDSYILLTNEQMVIAYNAPENTFIVTANGKTNSEVAERDSRAYLKALGITDLGKINLEFRTRGQW